MIATAIGTYGDPAWVDLAYSRAVPSIIGQRPTADYMHVHGETLAKARNEAADALWRPFGRGHFCFLDADDELAPGYFDAIEAEILSQNRNPSRTAARLYVPRVEYVFGRKRYAPRFPKEVPYEQGNWLVIGTVVPMWLFRQVGGFEEFPLYEDWALFARMQRLGAVPVRVPDAIYVAHRRAGSRNHPSREEKLAAHDAISRAVWPEKYAEAV